MEHVPFARKQILSGNLKAMPAEEANLGHVNYLVILLTIQLIGNSMRVLESTRYTRCM